VVIDSLSEIRLLAQSSLRYRRQILALKHYFAQNNSTVIMLDDLTTETTDRAVHSIAHHTPNCRASPPPLQFMDRPSC
jgi:circadian clock protein KaiC